MRGSIQITKEEVDFNAMGWTVFDLFGHKLREITTKRAGWYAFIEKNGVYEFKWADSDSLPSDRYLEALKKDGYTLGISGRAIELAFQHG